MTNKQNLTQFERSQIVLSPQLQQITVGCILGDICIQKGTNSKNANMAFLQGIIHQEYLMYLFDLFQDFCLSVPKICYPRPDKRTGQVYPTIRFTTRSLPCFTELHSIFYPDGKKIVPSNIYDLLTPLGLAFWIADDGCICQTKNVVTLCTNSFTLDEVTLLANTLNDKWNLECYINKQRNSFIIRIPRSSLPILQSLVKDIMPPMMLYKIGL